MGGLELSGSRSGRVATVSRELRLPPALVGPAFGSGNTRCSGLRAGDRPGSGIPSGVLVAGGDEPLAIRGWAASSGAFHPAPEAELPCRSRLLDGRCPSNFDATLSGDGRSPSPVSGSWPVRDRAASREEALGSHRSREFPRGASGGREGNRASGGFLETSKQRVCFAPPSGRKGSFGILARARGEPYGLEEVSPPKGRQDRTSESRFEGMAGPTG